MQTATEHINLPPLTYKDKSSNDNLRHKRLSWIIATTLSLLLSGSVFFFTEDNFVMGVLMLIIPFPLVFMGWVFSKPLIGFIAVFFANYFAVGLSRYIPGPMGLSVDGLLLLTWVSLIFSQFNKKIEWSRAWNGLTIVAIIWFGYTLFQFFNPEAVSRAAWFYAMRGISLYILLLIPLVFILYNTPAHMEQFIKLLAWFTILAVLKGMMQKFLFVDPWEDKWLDEIGGITHRLPGGLRIFSFFPDSATYGGSMGLSGVIFTIMGLHEKDKHKRMFYLFTGGFALFGLLISGTRGAMAVPAAGFSMYTLLSKRFKIFIIGTIFLIAAYSFMKYSTIGNSVYEIRRFRNGLDPDNPSLMVRHENKKKFKLYLSSRPIGGGIGSAGNWGLRFSPGTFLAETPPDGWYVQIWAEQGKVGLSTYFLFLGFILLKTGYITMFKLKNETYRAAATGFISGLFGVMAASYSSSALGQMPNVIIIYTSMAFIFLMPDWEEKAGRSP